jgi:hypothetical protein
MENGSAGYIGKVCTGPLLPITQLLVPGTTYYVSEIPGQVAPAVNPTFLSVKLGFAVSDHFLMIDR